MTTILQTITRSVKHWYIPLIVGIILIAAGIYVFMIPVETYLSLSVLFCISFIVIGLLDVFFSIRNRKILQGWGWYLVGGLFSLVVGILLIVHPGISVLILPYVVGSTLLFLSFLLMGFSFEMKSVGILNWGNTAVISVLGAILAFMLILNPVMSGISLVAITGFSFIVTGIASIVLSFDLRKVKKIPEKLSADLKEKIAAVKKEIDEENAAK